MNIRIYSICKNESQLIPFYLRHYKQFASEIIVYDDKSTDGSRELLEAGGVEVRETDIVGLNDDAWLHAAMEIYKEARGKADWVMWVDMDEFIYHPELVKVLTETPHNVLTSKGYNMVSDGFPVDDGRQIWEINPMGAHPYDKPVVFRPDVNIRWTRGRHDLECCDVNISPFFSVKLFHYRYLGVEYTEKRNAKNYENVGADKGAAWSCAPGNTGHGGGSYAEDLAGISVNAVTDSMA